VSGANDPAPVSGANDPAPVSEATVTDDHEPHIKVLKGNPTDAELAALLAVLANAGGEVAASGADERDPWGHPVDKLRYPIFSWQRVTLLERTHMRR
jgi:hypothetical protein